MELERKNRPQAWLREKVRFSLLPSPSLVIKLDTWEGTHSFVHSFVKSLGSGHCIPGTAPGGMTTKRQRSSMDLAFKQLSPEGMWREAGHVTQCWYEQKCEQNEPLKN